MKYFNFEGTINGLSYWGRPFVFGLIFYLWPEDGPITWIDFAMTALCLVQLWLVASSAMKRTRALGWGWSKLQCWLFAISIWVGIILLFVVPALGAIALIAWFIIDLILIFRNSNIEKHNG